MFRPLIAKLLFCIALLAQIGGPAGGAAAMASQHGVLEAGYCDPSSSLHAPGAVEPGKAPGGKHGHHGGCAVCPTCVDGATFTHVMVWNGQHIAARSRRATANGAPGFIPAILWRAAAPRAPPSLV